MTRVLLLLALLAAPMAHGEAPSRVRRLALLVGVNDGGPGRARLRYAASDAQSFARVLGELGGVTPADRVMLLETGRAGLLEGFTRLKALAESARASGAHRVEVLLYYSGHSDDEGLLLQGERMDYGELRRALGTLPADVRIAVLDSCASGAFARRKGGSPRPAFLVDSGVQVKGQAILTSSSEDEASQESDRLGGSFFTHHLVSGLRGAADVTRDGRVTLNEAYQFAFNETLARTERTQGGAQHPAYDIEMAGTGDLVMTDLRATSAGLVLTEALEGRLYVRDESGALVVELMKTAGRPAELGLAPGRYRVRRELGGGMSEASLVLTEGKSTPLAAAHFSSVLSEATVSRGGPAGAEAEVSAVGPARRRVPFNASLVPGVSFNALVAGEAPVENAFALGVVNDGTALHGAALGLGANVYGEEVRGLSAAVGMNMAGGKTRGVQASVGLNISGGALNGMQAAVGANWAGGSVEVGQLAAGVNVAMGSVSGVQGSAGVNVAAGDFRGAQATAGVNVTRGAFRGLQLASGINMTQKGFHGAQVAAGVNWAGGALSGVQVSSGFNRAQGLSGLQLGLLNVGGDVTGAQVGLVNIGGVVKGGQVGLLNVAKEVHGVPLGLLSFVKEGQRHVEFWSSDIQLTNVGVKLGSQYVYSTLVAGIGPDDRFQRFSLGLGVGVHLPLSSRFWVDVDTVASGVHSREEPFQGETLLAQARVMAGFQIFSHFAVFAGPTYNAYFAFSPEGPRSITTMKVSEHKLGSDGTVQHWPGLQLGLRI
ncbi:caspase family protein [Stigmatella aurantiaca]|uniref:ICE-like protease (Caspase) n=3 Tax=Stigmatella aurantiaca TaxID=41 RepID=E3FUV3_STIAD|nr:caspase family protein [Stigmatella aurantiaca]ADO68391.1 ICE-like protease (Caspase) [Stigmatella aurantiaca DW4/3-1]